MSHYLAAGLALLLAALAGCQPRASGPAPQKTMHAFQDEAQLDAFLKDAAEQAGERTAEAAVPPAGAPADAGASAIVREHGRHLVLLRRGRLLTVDIGKDQLKLVAALDARAQGDEVQEEMAVADGTVALIGRRPGGTGIALFDIDAAGRLRYRASYQLRAGLHGAAMQESVRQIGSKLVLYSALALDPLAADQLAALPALRGALAGADPAAAPFTRIAPANRIHVSEAPIDPDLGLVLHSVTVCDLAMRALRCDASAVLGPPARAFHMAPEAVYVWSAPHKDDAGASLYRMPLNGGAPGAIRVSGAPHDPSAFHESADGHVNVLVGPAGAGQPSWRGQAGADDLALLRLPLTALSDGSESAAPSSYKQLPAFASQQLRSRYVGPWLLYGSAGDGGAPLYALRWDGTGAPQRLALAHPAEHIAPMGDDAVVTGQAQGELSLSSVRLRQQAALANTHVHALAEDSTAVRHGFHYTSQRPGQGMVGLPLVQTRQPQAAGEPDNVVSVLYLRNTALKLRELGTLKAQGGERGDALPLFVQGRVFALMGDELVEGKLKNGRLREVRRIDLAPASAQ
ncbi:hypothetical protein CR152_13145 [Massilia violaceinigra]|uniref:Uncharacterized protein n=1 Tax=Massilia violaceinigra TaxID=2045208 RepID=A0A2D2DK48_9BURK|nr:hypothetical protein [Massilia violaceinigra]ATQ75356.1 hypothetical protein CR152_13145 [Massilia violaceinigra]